MSFEVVCSVEEKNGRGRGTISYEIGCICRRLDRDIIENDLFLHITAVYYCKGAYSCGGEMSDRSIQRGTRRGC